MSEKKDPVLESIAQTKAAYKRLGKSGLRVSVPIFGAMSFGHEAWQPWVIDEERVTEFRAPSRITSVDSSILGSPNPQGSIRSWSERKFYVLSLRFLRGLNRRAFVMTACLQESEVSSGDALIGDTSSRDGDLVRSIYWLTLS